MRSDDIQPAEHKEKRSPIRVGGWSDYSEWSRHDFRDRTAADEVRLDGKDPAVVEVLTGFALIAVADVDLSSDGKHPRLACRLMPPPWIAGAQTTDGRGVDSCDFDDGYLDSEGEIASLRPYVRTAGRVQAAHDLEFETILTSTGLHENWSGDTELANDHLRICQLCQLPQSMAEIAAAIEAPFGVAKVLVSDAIDQDLLIVHATIADRPSLALLKRVRSCLAGMG